MKTKQKKTHKSVTYAHALKDTFTHTYSHTHTLTYKKNKHNDGKTKTKKKRKTVTRHKTLLQKKKKNACYKYIPLL